MKPLLAHKYEPHRVTYPCYVQPKLNGIRALYQNGRFQSRDELPFGDNLLSHLAEPLMGIFGPEVILDGELYKHGWPLQRINAAVTPVRLAPTEDTLQVEYHVFDVVDFKDSFENRQVIRGGVTGKGMTRVPSYRVTKQEEAEEIYAQFITAGYEGMMYRLGDCSYTVPKQQYKGLGLPKLKFLSDKNNRTWLMLKRKDWQDDEFVCVGVAEGEGKYRGTLGALVCLSCNRAGPTSLRFTVGSGLTDAERDHYWQNPPINQPIKVKYLTLSSDGIPLNPTILAVL